VAESNRTRFPARAVSELSRAALTRKSLVLMSCYDFRNEPEHFPVSRRSVEQLPRIVKERYDYYHISDLRPLGFRVIVKLIDNTDLWKKILDYPMSNNGNRTPFTSLPMHHYVSAVVALADSKILVSYAVPEQVFDDVAAEIDGGELVSAYTIPVHNCYGEIGLSEKNVERGRRLFSRKFEFTKVRTRMPFLDYMLVAMLDYEPLTTKKGLRSVEMLLRSRFDEELSSGDNLRFRYVLRHYNMLSRHGVIGRVRVKSRDSSHYFTAIVMVERRCADVFYGVLAASLSTTRMLLGDKVAVAGVHVPSREKSKFSEYLAGCVVDLKVPIKGYVFSLPFEMYDPETDTWHLYRPPSGSIVRALRKYRLVEARA